MGLAQKTSIAEKLMCTCEWGWQLCPMCVAIYIEGGIAATAVHVSNSQSSMPSFPWCFFNILSYRGVTGSGRGRAEKD